MKTTNRWTIAAAATVVMICLGTVYSWSLFTRPLVAMFQTSNTLAALAFGIAMFSVGWGAVAGARWERTAGPRTVTTVGVLLWGLGNALAGLGLTTGIGWLYVSYGIVGGFGSGMAYIAPLSVVRRWFPDLRATVNAIVVMGYSVGALVYNETIAHWPPFAATLQHAAANLPFSGDDVGATMNVLIFTGLLFAVIGCTAAFALQNPPKGYAVRAAVERRPDLGRSYAPREALRMHEFYLLWAILFLNTFGGMAIVGNAIPIYGERAGVGVAVAAPIFGLVVVSSGLGRLLWTAVAERFGATLGFVAIALVQTAAFVALANAHSRETLVTCFAVVLLCYGGSFGTMPLMCIDYLGPRYARVNYAMLLTAWGFSALAGTLVGSIVRDVTGSFAGAMVPVAAVSLLAAIVPLVTRKPAERINVAAPSP
jgi:OFA family oxalate/formate antiporter-like MFS transporter